MFRLTYIEFDIKFQKIMILTIQKLIEKFKTKDNIYKCVILKAITCWLDWWTSCTPTVRKPPHPLNPILNGVLLQHHHDCHTLGPPFIHLVCFFLLFFTVRPPLPLLKVVVFAQGKPRATFEISSSKKDHRDDNNFDLFESFSFIVT